MWWSCAITGGCPLVTERAPAPAPNHMLTGWVSRFIMGLERRVFYAGTKNAPRLFKEMQYKGAEYRVVQGIDRGLWKWSVSVAGMVLTGQEETRPAAIAAAEKAIDRALKKYTVTHQRREG
jgi:hypothetical protein